MGTYDDYKLRSDRDDTLEDVEEEDRTPSEAEFAIIEAERAYETLVQWHGQDEARLILFRIMRKEILMAIGNIDLWDALATTPPSATKPFQRGGGFRGKSIDPMYRYHRMTEQFGPCGTGWGMHSPVFQTVPAGEEILVFCTIVIWYGPDNAELVGVGGDKVLVKSKYGISADDEGFKKAYTDAIGNALKYLGVGADVFMGQHDDDKYVRALMQAEQGEGESDDRQPFEPVTYPNPPVRPSGLPATGYRKDGARTAHSLKQERPNDWPDFEREVAEVVTIPRLTRLAFDWSAKTTTELWPPDWRELARERINQRRQEILNTIVEDNDVFPGDRR